MKSIFLGTLFHLIISLHSWATAFEGTITRSGQNILVKLANFSEPISLKGINSYVDKELSRLESGDWISGKGTLENNDSTLLVNAVGFVGLKKILGLWTSNNLQIFNFKNFSQIDFYEAASFNLDLDLNVMRFKSLRYSLAPDDSNNWSILLVDRNSVDIGNVVINENRIKLQLYDSSTGLISKTYVLTPIAHTIRSSSEKNIKTTQY